MGAIHGANGGEEVRDLHQGKLESDFDLKFDLTKRSKNTHFVSVSCCFAPFWLTTS